MPKPAFNLYEAAAGQPWLITQAALERVLAIVEAHSKAPDWRPDFAALAADLGRPLENTQETTNRPTPHGNVAVIPIHGPIFPHANSLHAISGATTIETLQHDFAEALDNSKVQGIVLSIDSPGGAVSGVSEFANAIRNRTTRKPVVAYVEQLAASAAYWIAAAADSIISGPSGEVGSIGVVISASKDGGRTYEFVSRQSPAKRPDPETEAGRKQLVDRASDIAGVFIDQVAEFRGVSAEKVEADFGKGDVMVARKALAAGMVDRVEHFSDVLARGTWVDTAPRVTGQATAAPATSEADDMGILSKLFKGKEGESEKDAEARMERLVGAMGDKRADFAVAQHKAGNDVPQAVDALVAEYAAKTDALAKENAELAAKLQAASAAHGEDAKHIADLEAKIKDAESRPPTGQGMGSPAKTDAADKEVLAAMVAGANRASN